MPSATRIDSAVGLKADTTSSQLCDYPRNVASVLREVTESNIKERIKALNLTSRTSIPLCCRPSKEGRPSACNCSGMPMDLCFSPGFG